MFQALKIWHLQPIFALSISSGKLSLLKGKPAPSFVKAAQDIVDDTALQKGLVMLRDKGRGPQLVFSKEFSETQKQRFRNAWLAYR